MIDCQTSVVVQLSALNFSSFLRSFSRIAIACMRVHIVSLHQFIGKRRSHNEEYKILESFLVKIRDRRGDIGRNLKICWYNRFLLYYWNSLMNQILFSHFHFIIVFFFFLNVNIWVKCRIVWQATILFPQVIWLCLFWVNLIDL